MKLIERILISCYRDNLTKVMVWQKMNKKEQNVEKFSEKSLLSLGDYYVYGLIDPRNRKIFYIGKGTGNRVFEHELESQGNPESEKLKLKRIAEIKAVGLEVEKVIINCNLTEAEAFAAEAALYFTYSGILGHHVLIADIAVFLLGLFFAFRFAWKGKDTPRTDTRRKWIYLLTALLALLFFIFTFYPPRIGLFLDLS